MPHIKTYLVIIALAVITLAIILYLPLSPADDNSGLPDNETSNQSQCPDFTPHQITLGDQRLAIGLASTPAQQAQGLSGCPLVPDRQGLLFPFNPPRQTSFWMKDMLIPIDIIWIKDNVITGIEHRVNPPPSLDTDDSQLTKYPSPGPVTAVLELAAGQARELGLTPGVPVKIDIVK